MLDDSHANYVRTVLSMATTLNMAHLTDRDARVARQQHHTPVYELLQDPLVARQFKALGYRYIHIGSWFGPTRTDAAADRNLYVRRASDFAATLFDDGGPCRAQAPAPAQERKSTGARGYDNGMYALDARGHAARRARAEVRDRPCPPPHPPVVFDEDGQLHGRAAQRSARRTSFRASSSRRTRASSGPRRAVQSLPEDRRPIVILQADEGPYPPSYRREHARFDWSTATLDELAHKYGILNAWYVPGGSDLGLSDSMTSVNTFPTLFSRLLRARRAELCPTGSHLGRLGPPVRPDRHHRPDHRRRAVGDDRLWTRASATDAALSDA